jgi:hypothetical protein
MASAKREMPALVVVEARRAILSLTKMMRGFLIMPILFTVPRRTNLPPESICANAELESNSLTSGKYWAKREYGGQGWLIRLM